MRCPEIRVRSVARAVCACVGSILYDFDMLLQAWSLSASFNGVLLDFVGFKVLFCRFGAIGMRFASFQGVQDDSVCCFVLREQIS